MEFETQFVNSRKDLLHFVEEELDKKVLEKLGKNPNKWIEELEIISLILTGRGLVAGINTGKPDLHDPNLKQLDKNVFLLRNASRDNGLWISEEYKGVDTNSLDGKLIQWTHYPLGGRGHLNINKEFNYIPFENFLPENFELKSKLVKKNRRPVFTFDIETNKGKLNVYAKSCLIETSRMYYPPSYRLTNLAQAIKTNSEKELNRFVELSEQGVMVPTILGYYETKLEEFLFVKGLEGDTPDKFLKSNRKEIIEQDARILAALLLTGYKKHGFTDFDDKIFDGKNLYLIDVDELSDFYFPHFNRFREILLNPLDQSGLDEFRKIQKGLFEQHLKDTIFIYKTSLTQTIEDKILYVSSFFERMNWGKPTEDYVKRLTDYPDNYITLESEIGMMMEE